MQGFLHGCGKKRRRVLEVYGGRFWITSIFTLRSLDDRDDGRVVSHIQSVAGDFSGDNADHVGSRSSLFIKSAWASFRQLIYGYCVALGTLVAYVYSVFALLLVSQYTLRLPGFIIFFTSS